MSESDIIDWINICPKCGRYLFDGHECIPCGIKDVRLRKYWKEG